MDAESASTVDMQFVSRVAPGPLVVKVRIRALCSRLRAGGQHRGKEAGPDLS